MSAQFSKILWFALRMPAKWGILECRHMWHSKFQSWVRKPQYFPIFEAKTCHKQFIDWPEIYPKAFQVPSSTPSCMIRIAWGNHVYPSEGFYQNLEYIQKALKAQRNRTLMPKSLALFHSFPRNSTGFEVEGWEAATGRRISEQQGKNPWNVCIKRYPKEQVKHVKIEKDLTRILS